MKCYISHRISNGGKDELLKQNTFCKRAIEFGDDMRALYPNIDFYIPAEHEDFVRLCYENKLLTIKQILDIDCKIIDTCDFVVMFVPDFFISAGMWEEYKHALMSGKQVIFVSSSQDFGLIDRYLESLKG